MNVVKSQIKHLIFLVIALWAISFICNNYPVYLKGELWGIPTKTWLYIAVASPIIHQVYVFVCWYLELYHQTITKTFGKAGFGYYKIGFALLIISRPISVALLAISNANTLDVYPVFSYLVAIILIIPSVYLFYSVKKYFGIDRAFGIDHFEPEKAKNYPSVKNGIYKYTSNGMYVYGFFILWIIAILFRSKGALLLAAFNHLYIWVHYYYTEKPDMDFIYGKKKD